MKITKYNIPWSKPLLLPRDKKFLNKAYDSSWISGGEFITKFQIILKKFIGRKFAYATCNGTSAIHLAYLSLGLKKNDEIIVPGFGYMAAANIGKLMNLKVKFCDVDIETYCLSLDSLKKSITKKTKAVVVINTYGNIDNIQEIQNFLKKKNIFLIEDAAESLGSKYKNNYSGNFGDISTLSFHATKNITTGEGGMVLTDNLQIAKKIRLYRSHGVNIERYFHYVFGHNFRLSNLLAAIGFAQSNKIKNIIKKRKEIYNYYLKNLNLNFVNLQKLSSKEIVPWTLPLTLKNKKVDKLYNFLKLNNIETRKGFYSANRMPIYNANKNLIKNSDFLSKNVICLPLYVGISNSEISYICKKINSYFLK